MTFMISESERRLPTLAELEALEQSQSNSAVAQARVTSVDEKPSKTLPIEASNRRWSDRVPINRVGLIGCADKARLRCQVLNLSKHGAMVECDSHEVGDAFVMVFWANRVRSEVSCIVRWRALGRIGVAFAGPIRTSVDARKRA